MSTRNIKGVVFDFGRVLADFDHQRTCRALGAMANLPAEEVFRRIFKEGLERRFDEGKVSSLGFWREVTQVLGADIPFETFAAAWGDIFSPNPAIETVLERLRPDLGRVVLSNTNRLHWDYIEKLPIMRRFFSRKEGHVLSFEIGVKKPAEIMYKKALELLGSLPAETLYLDDIEEYAIAFRKLGGNAIVYDCTKQLEEELLEALEQYDVFR